MNTEKNTGGLAALFDGVEVSRVDGGRAIRDGGEFAGVVARIIPDVSSALGRMTREHKNMAVFPASALASISPDNGMAVRALVRAARDCGWYALKAGDERAAEFPDSICFRPKRKSAPARFIQPGA